MEIPKWEFKSVEGEKDFYNNTWNDLGQMGWELVSVNWVDKNRDVYRDEELIELGWFKRQLNTHYDLDKIVLRDLESLRRADEELDED